MLRLLQLFLYLVLIIVLQVSILPTYLEDPFQPNLIIIFVCYLALRGKNTLLSAVGAYFAGLLLGAFSGLNFGLAGISSLLVFLFLRKISDQLYTESNQLIVFAVFISTLADALVSLVLIALLSNASGLYLSILTNMIPQALITAIFAMISFACYSLYARRLAN